MKKKKFLFLLLNIFFLFNCATSKQTQQKKEIYNLKNNFVNKENNENFNFNEKGDLIEKELKNEKKEEEFKILDFSFKDNKEKKNLTKGSFYVNFNENDEKNFLVIKDLKTKKEWIISYKEFKILILGYSFWRELELSQPSIEKIEEDEEYFYIYISYKQKNSKMSFNEQNLLLTKVSLKKKYLNFSLFQEREKNYLIYFLGGMNFLLLITILVILI